VFKRLVKPDVHGYIGFFKDLQCQLTLSRHPLMRRPKYRAYPA
jgi:hypothetical protein